MDSVTALLSIDTLGLAVGIFAVLAAAYYFLAPRPKPETPVIRLGESRQQSRAVDPLDGRPVVRILFGSQTGTAEMFAKTLGKTAKNYGFNPRVEDLMDYQRDDLSTEKLVIFVVATYGEGEPTDTAKDFYDWFNEQTPETLDLSNVRYTVFGLGDTQYKLYNFIGKHTDKRLKELGAKSVFRRGEGDADKTLEEDFDNWREELWPALAAEFGTTIIDSEPPAFEPQTLLEAFPEEAYTRYRFGNPGNREPGPRFPVYVPVLRNDELLTNCPERSTKHMELDISAFSKVGYEAGDHLAIYPANPAKLIDEYLGVLDLQSHKPETVICLRSKKGPMVMSKCSLREALMWYIDLSSPPKKEVLRTFAQYSTDDDEKEKLRALFKDAEQYKKLAEKLRNVFGWLRKFQSIRLPIHAFLEVMPQQQVRYYSIASDYMSTPKQIALCYAVVDNGVCTNFLKDLKEGDTVPIFVRRSTFHIPRQPAASTILIGPGTGVAPLIGFLWRRKALRAKEHQLGECHFYFGCRNRTEDFLYGRLLEECEAEGIITRLNVAFSREQAEKVYVQHLIAKNSEEIWRLLSAKASIFICGDAKHMARDVEEALKQIVQTHGAGLETAKAADEYLTKLQQDGRFLKDVWTTK